MTHKGIQIILTNACIVPTLTKAPTFIVGIGIRKQLLMFMMRTFIFLCCVSVFSITPNHIVSQNAKIKIKADNTLTVDEVFGLIMKQTDYNFIYQDGLFKDFPRVLVKKGTTTAGKLLQESIASANLNVILTANNTIIIKEKNTQQQIKVSGKVTDEVGMPVAGATVLIKGTTRGVATDFDGSYSITVPNPENVLVFSALGFATQEITVGSQSIINVTLKEAINELDEVTINAGYYKTTKRQATGSISKVTASVIEKQPVSNPLLALQGRIPGVVIEQFSGLPGGLMSIQIRGRNSINRNIRGNPLFIVDGVPYPSDEFERGFGGILGRINALNSLNPADIESIEVLKDADATAIYGSRGANGVILITTKQGQSDRTNIEVNIASGISEVGHFMDLLNTPQYLEMKIEGFQNEDLWPRDPSQYAFDPDLFIWDTTRYTNWQKKLIGGIAENFNAGISVSGGNNRLRYLISGNYLKQGTVFPGDYGYKKGSGLLKLSSNSGEQNKFSFSVSVNYTIDQNDLPYHDLTNEALFLAPNAPKLYDDNGNYNWENNTWINPIAANLEPQFIADGKNLITNVNLQYEILPSLKAKTNLGYNSRLLKRFATTPFASSNPQFYSSFQASSSFGNSSINSWIIEPQLEYQPAFLNGSFKFLLGSSFQSVSSSDEVLFASGFTSDAFLRNIKAAPNVSVTQFEEYKYRYAALFGRINYNFRDKYIINLTGRRDGSSRFGKGNRFGNFGAVGIAWIFSQEDFFSKHIGFISYGKLRSSFGITGSDNIGNYQYLDSYANTINPYQGVSGVVPVRLANDNYGWESNKKFESAIELGLFEDKINFTASHYINRSSNQLVGYPLSVVTGQPSIQQNLPATVQNTGWEFELNTINLKGEVEWRTNINLSVPRNKLIHYPDLENSAYSQDYVVGQPLSVIRGFKYLGVDPISGNYEFEDLNGDGQFTADDYQVVGNKGIDYLFGLSNTLSINNKLKVDVFIQGVKQTGYNYINYFSNAPGYNSENEPTEVLNRWRAPGDITDVQKFGGGGSEVFENYQRLKISDKILTDASFIRLKNVQVSYDFPFEWGNLEVYVQGQNLLTLTNYIGLDPENQSSITLPPLRTFVSGLKLNF
ncbi:MAG TPA: SusC/RagA family TonB-linked outer membrane protein [Flavobacteriaceae bacterium]